MASSGRVMEKPTSQQDHHQTHQQQKQALKCPRCDSSNTKFCYYNNYSLSQPRHFCKACKRYWTRGGTLRNVPVGGGCRKNKRVKRPSSLEERSSTSSSAAAAAAAATASISNPSLRPPHLDLPSSTSPHINVNPLFYGLPTNPSGLNLAYPRFDLQQPSVNNVLGLGFSSRLMGSSDVVTSNPLFSSTAYNNNNNNPLHGSSSTTSNSTTSTLASLIASSFQQQKANNVSPGNNSFSGLLNLENMHMGGGTSLEYGMNMMMKDMKMEGSGGGGQDRLINWNVNNDQNQAEQNDASLWSSTNGVGAWLDPSVPSLI